jgi:hypothetical protein
MAGIFTRKSIAEIMSNDQLTPEERTDQVFSLYGRAIDDGFVTKGAAAAAQASALEQAKTDWEKSIPKPDPKESDEYKALRGEYDAYKAMQTARGSDEYKGIKGKFFETVYGLIDRADGAKPVNEQIADIRKNYEEYFEPEPQTQPAKPQFGARTEGSMPKGNEGAVAGFVNAWGFKGTQTK